MEIRRVGDSGLQVSSVGLGAAPWGTAVTAEEARELTAAFMDSGGNLCSVAPEDGAGAAMQTLGQVLPHFSRDEFVLSVSAGVNPHRPLGSRVDCSRRFLLSQLDDTLRTLGTEFIDVWSVGYWDRMVPLEEVCSTLDYAQRTGRVRYAGVREYNGWQLALTHTVSEYPVVAAQAEYSLLRREVEAELFPAAEYLGVGFFATSALAHGILARKRGEALPDTPNAHLYRGQHADTLLDALHTAAEGLGNSAAVTALAWVRDQPGVSSVLVEPPSVARWRELSAVTETRLPGAIAKALSDISV